MVTKLIYAITHAIFGVFATMFAFWIVGKMRKAGAA
jgi:hypothetical protein